MKQGLVLICLLSLLLLAACAPAGQLPPLLSLPSADATAPVEPAVNQDTAASSAAEPGLSGSAALALDDPLPLDPAVRLGRLDNGLTYYVQRNDKPAQRAELRLVVNAGSVLEGEGERGLAHFLEHMLFNGTRRFPAQTLVDAMERMGMEFGPDANAYTTADETVYMLQAPTDQDGLLDTAFDILLDWAAYATLSPEEIDKERSVVIEEQRLREQNADGRVFAQTWPALTAGTAYADRLPMGDLELIRTAPAEALRRFYETWYRPDLMAVVAVGDFDVDQVEGLIRERFADLPAAVAAQPRPEPPAPQPQGWRYLQITDPEYPYSVFSIDTVTPAVSTQTVGDFRDMLVDVLAGQMFNTRLQELGRQADAPFLYAYAMPTRLARQVDSYTLSGQTTEEGLLAGLEAVLREQERVRRYGFTQQELDRARADSARSYQNLRSEQDKLESQLFAQGYVDHYLTGAVSPSSELLADLAQRFLPEISLDQVNQAFDVLLPAGGQLVTVIGPEKNGVTLPDEQQVAALFAQVASADLDPYEERAVVAQLMQGAPPAAQVVAQQEFPELGISQFELANGVQVIVKPTDFWADDIVFSATSPGGSSLASDEDYAEASTIAYLVGQSGVGDVTQSELEDMLAGALVSVAPEIYESTEGFSGFATAEDLELAFQLMHLYVTEPRLDPAVVQSYQSQAKASLVNLSLDPRAALQETLTDALFGKTVRRGPLPLEEIEQFDSERALAIYRERFGDVSDFTFTFVGNVDVAEIKRLAQQYLGTLPGDGRVETWRDVAPTRFSDVVERSVFKGQEEQSIVQLIFTDAVSVTQESSVQMDALEALLDIRLNEDLREARGGTYSPVISTGVYVTPTPIYVVRVEWSADPQRMDELVGALFDQIVDLQANGPSPAELAKVQEQLRRNREEALRDNNFWLDALEYHFTAPGAGPNDILAYDDLLAGLEPADLQAAAQQFLPRDHYIRVTLYPESLQP